MIGLWRCRCHVNALFTFSIDSLGILRTISLSLAHRLPPNTINFPISHGRPTRCWFLSVVPLISEEQFRKYFSYPYYQRLEYGTQVPAQLHTAIGIWASGQSTRSDRSTPSPTQTTKMPIKVNDCLTYPSVSRERRWAGTRTCDTRAIMAMAWRCPSASSRSWTSSTNMV